MDYDFRGRRVVVLSRTLDPKTHPDVEVVADRVVERVRALSLRSQRTYPSGIVWLEYDVAR